MAKRKRKTKHMPTPEQLDTLRKQSTLLVMMRNGSSYDDIMKKQYITDFELGLTIKQNQSQFAELYKQNGYRVEVNPDNGGYIIYPKRLQKNSETNAICSTEDIKQCLEQDGKVHFFHLPSDSPYPQEDFLDDNLNYTLLSAMYYRKTKKKLPKRIFSAS